MSRLLESIHKTAADLRDKGHIDKQTMREFDALCLTPVAEMGPKDIQSLRTHFDISQSVFACYLNVSVKAVQKWERGEATPKGAALKLLSLAKKNGIDAIA
ncbi:DNA-binding transcriptional regulator [Vibrio tritonius]|uniref:DNA-binding transcriptional regulator n=1 Tax=Vibrio tritonius TaxID=1435069 RepID=A0ABS7YMS3_9VIBR|nr:DNA-binding transcriptional regulator [Vibrio tritonius]MCA2016966.1 DNA-binding transcriptional regulator [Vibrio tritonius]